MKKYKAIFFDWDGTAVLSRKAPVDEITVAMKRLLKEGIKLIVVSGTTYDNIAEGNLSKYFTLDELQNLYLGLGRGAYDYYYDTEGTLSVLKERIPSAEDLLRIHEISFEIHKYLLETYHFPTDIVFSRPNYCKIDLMVESNRGENLFFQESELAVLKNSLCQHGFVGGLKDLLILSEEIASKKEMSLSSTTDAKYLEIGLSSKSDNVDTILSHLKENYGIDPTDCAYWGDEYIGLDAGLYGSDSYMITKQTKQGEFFDVSDAEGPRPECVNHLKGGVQTFLNFLADQAIS